MNTKRVNERGVLMLVAMVVIIVVAVMTSAYLLHSLQKNVRQIPSVICCS